MFCNIGVHFRALEGGGAMGDALTCVECGLHKYPEVFGVAPRKREMPLNSEGFYMVGEGSSQTERVAAWNKAGRDI